METRDLWLASGSVEEAEDGSIWATILPVGEWKLRPGVDGRPANRPLRVVEGRAADESEVGLQDLLDAYRDGAIQHVTIPLTHADRVDENTGFIDDVAIATDETLGRVALRGKFRFTEPLIAAKVKRRSIAGRSAGIKFHYRDKETGKTYPSVLDHVALTNKPWIKGMPALGMSEDALVFEADGDPDQPGEDDSNSVSDDLKPDLDKLTDTLDDWSSGDLEVVAFDGTSAMVKDEDGDLWKVPVENGVPAAIDEWELQDADDSDEGARSLDTLAAMVHGDAGAGLSENHETPRRGGDQMGKYDNMTPEEIEAMATRLAVLEAKERTASVDAKIEAYSDKGYDKFPGLLRLARELMLADDGDVALNLSEDEKTISITATDIVERMLDAMPVDEATDLAEQGGEQRQAGKRPADEATEEDPKVRADRARRALKIQSELITT